MTMRAGPGNPEARRPAISEPSIFTFDPGFTNAYIVEYFTVSTGNWENTMSQKCMITGKKPLVGNNVSHANNKLKRRQNPNLQWKRIFVPELGRSVRIRITTRALRTINKKGLLPFLKDNGLTIKDLG
jgi:large subunit ribosomal protein L28